MDIKIHKEEEGGYSVYKKDGKRWRYWLPEAEVDCKGDAFYPFFKTAKSAEKAARAAKKALEAEEDIFMTI